MMPSVLPVILVFPVCIAVMVGSTVCSSVYLGVAVAVGVGGPSVRIPILLFEFAFAPPLVFVPVLQAANAMLNNTISDNKQAFFLISNFPFQNPQSIRSPGAGDSL